MKRITDIAQMFPRGTKKRKAILAIFAHPDDESLRTGGLLAGAHACGLPTYLLCLTAGEKGSTRSRKSAGLKVVRRRELRKAAEILGITGIAHKNLPDGKLYAHQNRLKETIIQEIRRVQPSVIVTHDPSGITNHPDHITISSVVMSLVKQFFPNIHIYVTVLGKQERTVRFHANRNIFWKTMPKPTHVLNIGRWATIKSAACRAHASQRLTHVMGIETDVWFQLFDSEYFHLIDFTRYYRFVWVPYRAACLHFAPNTKHT